MQLGKLFRDTTFISVFVTTLWYHRLSLLFVANMMVNILLI